MATVKTTSLNSFQVLARLRERFKAPEFAFFAEVSSGTGGNARRRADGLAMSLWPSRGLYINGFEIKVSRSDLLNELKNPAKAETIAQYCDYWYLVLGDASLINVGELPTTWGLIVPKGNGLVVAKEATKLEPKELNRSFLASLIRSTHNADTTQQQISEAVSRARQDWYQRGIAEGQQKASYRLPRLEQELTDLKEIIKQFEEASGISLTKESWRRDAPRKMGEAVKLILDGGIDHTCEKLQHAKRTAAQILEEIQIYEDLHGPHA